VIVGKKEKREPLPDPLLREEQEQAEMPVLLIQILFLNNKKGRGNLALTSNK